MILYYQTIEGNIPFQNLCSSAAIGARFESIKTVPFVGIYGLTKNGHKIRLGINDITGEPNNIIVGTVEACETWLENHEYNIPKPIDSKIILDKHFVKEYYKRNIDIIPYEQLGKQRFPKFIKPYDKIKAFTGFVMKQGKIREVELYGYNHKGLFQVQDVIELESEYRVYIHRNNVIGIGHYNGNVMVFPDTNRILEILDASPVDKVSYTIDVGVTSSGETVIVEFNDAWAIANYGLKETKYFEFIKDRWLEITNTND